MRLRAATSACVVGRSRSKSGGSDRFELKVTLQESVLVELGSDFASIDAGNGQKELDVSQLLIGSAGVVFIATTFIAMRCSGLGTRMRFSPGPCITRALSNTLRLVSPRT
jgi:hypothetical protein